MASCRVYNVLNGEGEETQMHPRLLDVVCNDTVSLNEGVTPLSVPPSIYDGQGFFLACKHQQHAIIACLSVRHYNQLRGEIPWAFSIQWAS